MSLIGAMIGTIQATTALLLKTIQQVLPTARVVFSAAVIGATMRKTAGPRTATASSQSIGVGAAAFALSWTWNDAFTSWPWRVGPSTSLRAKG